jgi:HEAT repeat protein
MLSETEAAVLRVLTAIELGPSTARAIEKLGPEAITALCEIALGTMPGLRKKARTNAVAMLGHIDQPQVRETLLLLVKDGDTGVSIRAMRASGKLKLDEVTPELATMLTKPGTPPLLAAEAVNALAAIDSTTSRAAVESYRKVQDERLSHRSSVTVTDALARLQK